MVIITVGKHAVYLFGIGLEKSKNDDIKIHVSDVYFVSGHQLYTSIPRRHSDNKRNYPILIRSLIIL